MIASLLFAVTLAQTAPASPSADGGWCAGVAIRTPSGPANFLWLIATGNAEALRRFKAAAEAIPYVDAGEPRPAEFDRPTAPAGSEEVIITFRTMPHRPQESTNPADAVTLLQRAQRGDFGTLIVRPWIMGIETLPADRC